MTTLHDIFDYDAFQDAVEQGFIRVQTHPTEPFSIANYSEKAQYQRMWTPEILASRGLVYNHETLEIVARGFKKFFNWDDSGQPYPPTGPMVLSTKYDGSLGITYSYIEKNESKNDITRLAIATRGSFTSPQAEHATEKLYWMLQVLDHDDWIVDSPNTRQQIISMLERGFTPLFEIIYPENRIVVDYKGQDTLVLLDVINNETGLSDLTEFDNFWWPEKAEKRLVAGGFSDSLTHEIPSGEEGFVLYWPGSGFRCKMKSADYVELHRMVTGLSKKSVWEFLSQGKTADEIKDNVPDELFEWVDTTIGELNDAAAAIIDQVYEDYDTVQRMVDQTDNRTVDPLNWHQLSETAARPIFARHAQSFPDTRPYLFMVLDGKQPEDIWKAVFRTLKPVGDTRVWGRGEDVD